MDARLDLPRLREDLRQAAGVHRASVMHFYRPESGSFALTTIPNDPDEGEEQAPVDDEDDKRQIKGLTTTFTCLESLLDGAYGDMQDEWTTDARAQLLAFADKALSRPEDWESEGAAKTYCRVRSLAPIFRYYPNLADAKLATAVELLQQAWARVSANGRRDGIIEVGKESFEGILRTHYPPNAYLTYWAFEALRFAPEEARAVLDPKRRIAELWLEKTLGLHVSLHFAGSLRSDPQQIAWAISGLLLSQPAAIDERDRPVDELVRAGLRAFFASQREDGLWSRGEPLFHYPRAGNAYSYVYEALAVLISLSLGKNEASLTFRRLLEPYVPNLAAAYEAANRGRRVLELGTTKVGWCSGHHPFRTRPESWATASVFRFLQSFRKLVGVLSREASAKTLGARVAREDLSVLIERGWTWNTGSGSAGSQLASMFVHPWRALGDQEMTDPDQPVLADDWARSALLFGPPGTSKTTLIEAVAGALGWPFVEISPAAFLNRGIDMVSARADEVFDHLMELDHAVVLLDEIDELIRSRTGDSDPIERFFTTTMLPRLAKLWKRRAILFFVNTNSIGDVDRAVMRSQRFDAAIFVMPPSFQKKTAKLHADGVDVDWDDGIVNKIVETPDAVGLPQQGLAWLPFIRWDQMGRLRSDLKAATREAELVSKESAASVLHRFGETLLQTDWPLKQQPDHEPNDTERLLSTLQRYREIAQYQRRDLDQTRLVAVADVVAVPQDAAARGDGYWQILSAENDLHRWARDHGLWMNAGAYVHSHAPDYAS